jgi:hypothetical protein
MGKNPKLSLTKEDFAELNGCWVVIYEDEGYQDKSLLVKGPSSHGNLKNLPDSNGKDWGDDIDSIIVGPGCWLQVFADEGFNDTSAWYGPDTHAPGLGDMGDEIDSMILHEHPTAEYFSFLRREIKSNVK